MRDKRTWRRNLQPQRRVGNKFDDEFYLGETGCPIISDSLGYIEVSGRRRS